MIKFRKKKTSVYKIRTMNWSPREWTCFLMLRAWDKVKKKVKIQLKKRNFFTAFRNPNRNKRLEHKSKYQNKAKWQNYIICSWLWTKLKENSCLLEISDQVKISLQRKFSPLPIDRAKLQEEVHSPGEAKKGLSLSLLFPPFLFSFLFNNII